jgi:hypothetical protein
VRDNDNNDNNDNTNKIENLLLDMVENKVLEDRREYSREDLQSSYSLTEQEATDLHWMIQCNFNPKYINPYGFLEHRTIAEAQKFCEGCLEALHNSLDGWDSEHDRITIERFLSDIALYAKVATTDEEQT